MDMCRFIEDAPGRRRCAVLRLGRAIGGSEWEGARNESSDGRAAVDGADSGTLRYMRLDEEGLAVLVLLVLFMFGLARSAYTNSVYDRDGQLGCTLLLLLAPSPCAVLPVPGFEPGLMDSE